MKIIACHTVPKSLNDEGMNEDVFMSVGTPDDCSRVILADGATTGFAGGRFAGSIADAYVSSAAVKWKDIIIGARKLFAKQINPDTLSWSQKVSYTRGSFSTVLAVEEKDKGVLVTSVGDSCVFLIDMISCLPVCAFPLDEVSAFNNHPYLVGSSESDNLLFEPGYRRKYWNGRLFRTAELSGKWMLCATDALSAFIIANRADGVVMKRFLDSLQTHRRFLKFVGDNRKSGMMHIDDTTAILLDVQSNRTIKGHLS